MKNVSNKSKKMFLPFLVTLIAAVLLATMIFLPFASAKGEYKEWLKEYPELDYVKEIGMKNKDAVNISLFEFARIYVEAANQNIAKDTAIADVVIISVFAVFSVLVILLALAKKPIGVIIFDLLVLIDFWIIRFDFKDRSVLPSSSYKWGITNILVYVVGIVVFAAAVWLCVEKIRFKRNRKSEQTRVAQKPEADISNEK